MSKCNVKSLMWPCQKHPPATPLNMDSDVHQAAQQCHCIGTQCQVVDADSATFAQVDMGIHPLGHRQLLLQAISRLEASPPASSLSSGYGGDGGGGRALTPLPSRNVARDARTAAARQQARLTATLQRAEQLRAQHVECASLRTLSGLKTHCLSRSKHLSLEAAFHS